MKSFRKPCVASMRKEKKTGAMQRYTISGEKSRVVTRGRTRRRATVQRYTFFDRKACITDINNDRTPCSAQRHTFSQAKTCVASTEREKKTNRSHTTLHNTIRSYHKTTTHHTTPHHIISYHIIPHHITTISKPDNTTNRQTPYHTSNTIHHPTHNKKRLPQNRRKSFIDLSANRLSQQSFEATRVPTRGQKHRGWRRLTP